MELKFEVSTRVGRPVREVFEAVADPAKLSQYFTTGGAAGRLETGATVQWDFADFPGAFPVEVVEVIQDERIVLRWEANEGVPKDGDPVIGAKYMTTVTMTFSPLDDGGRTLVRIAEEGWRETPTGLKASYGNCMGWTQMLSALKASVEYGINLRNGAYA
ncbi:SRPBCC domain-containing protein [Brevundimonas subvibrioides]|uniref:Activator of Hsp90 ATPase 1 family protein n=1 Tax=Brevundimonas subvibrioides (strain ATCC 15264 / DSM 4735 / LMG 14903 / NBRC 16000 / CB 81) TaxID=633149 RepID=D9QKH1_BRESC|nr:SRPBCC domain-containing protein [Brevundimonas subvibrioides]ADK99796.1 Activator of Hsp90 ATPase 1 family protein [Brevundimonas subvibrioides ATCC 15264]